MPGWKTHIAFSYIVCLPLLKLSQQFFVHEISFYLSIILIPIYGILPDVDKSNTKARKVVAISVTFLLAILFAVKFLFGLLFLPIIYFLLVKFPSKHRGYTHTIEFCILSAIPWLFLYFLLDIDTILVSLITAIAALTHIFLDKMGATP